MGEAAIDQDSRLRGPASQIVRQFDPVAACFFGIRVEGMAGGDGDDDPDHRMTEPEASAGRPDGIVSRHG